MQNSMLVGSVFLAVLMGRESASAADIETRPYTKETFVGPVHNWSGAYIGGNIGYGWGESSDTSGLGPGPAPAVFTDALHSNMDGVVGGGQIGYNLQMENWVWGLEADFQGTGQSTTHSFTCPAGVCTTAAGALPVSQRQQLDFFGTLRGRAGFVVTPTLLLYATGGLATVKLIPIPL